VESCVGWGRAILFFSPYRCGVVWQEDLASEEEVSDDKGIRLDIPQDSHAMEILS
jgi:hypothetical protein